MLVVATEVTTENSVKQLGNLPREYQERQVTVSYRGIDLPLRVASARAEISKKLAAEVKTQAIRAKGLKQLSWECALFENEPECAHTVEQKLLRKFTAARTQAEDMVKGGGPITLQDALRILTYKKELLVQQDSSFDIELALLSHMTASGGKVVLQKRILASMPDEKKHKSIDDVSKKLEELKAGELCRLLGPSATGCITTCLEVLSGLNRGIPPNVAALKDGGYQEEWVGRSSA
eukprot:6492712-Amphidinium_carterae.2